MKTTFHSLAVATLIACAAGTVQAILAEPAFVQQHVTSKGLTVVAGDAHQLRETIAKEAEVTAAMIKAAGVIAE